jgi:serine/threonine-protein kinase PknG
MTTDMDAPVSPVAPYDASAAQRCRATANCPGLVLDGYCAVCGKRADAVSDGTTGSSVRGSAPSTSGGSSPSSSRGSTGRGSTGRPSTASSLTTGGFTRNVTTSQRSGTRWRGGTPLVELPFMPPVDPTSAIMDAPIVPEEKRFCSGCDATVGRTRTGKSGRVVGFCSKCRTPFSFVPALSPQDLLADQYRILGCLAYGGLGWIYLAQDERVSNRWVVLKGLLNAGDPSALQAALAERQFLARVEHPNVVRIYNVVEHTSGGYIVMEYVGGKTLKSVLRERKHEGLGPLPVDLAIAYILAVLPAFGYLHDLGLIYNDFKPDNVMLQGGDVKLIDLGAVTRLEDPDPIVYGTDGFQAPEMVSEGPSVASDLYSIARCLAVLVLELPAYQTTHKYRLPTPDQEPLFQQHESLYRFLMKATAHDPRDRYMGAGEMAEGLEAVLREVTATSQATPRPAPSKLFGGNVLDMLWASSGTGPAPDWRHLPPPRIDVSDAAASYVLDAQVLQPAQQVNVLREALANATIETTVEAQLALARAEIEIGRHAEAEAVLAWLEATDRREWRVNWYRGLSLLAQGRAAEATLAFDNVYSELPGELAPRLAMALSAELAGDLEASARHYDVVSSTDPGFTSASFGLARTRQALGDLDGVVEAYERIPPTSSLHVPAQLALSRALIRGGRTGPTVDGLVRASSVVERLQLSDELRAELSVGLFEAALVLLPNGTHPQWPDVRLLGQPLMETRIRFALERAYRDLAWIAAGDEKILLVECANEVRPMTSA